MCSSDLAAISFLCLIFLNPIMRFLNVPEDIFSESASYIRIIIAGMIITMIYNILIASARAIGDSITPLLTLFVSAERVIGHIGTETRSKLLREAAVGNIAQWAQA